jgi:uncharacterized flavoprotein (TIGR03862 family)
MKETVEAAIVGAGPAGLMAAEVLARGGARVVVFERSASPARKFLMAGRGGLNLTHGEPFEAFLARYREAAPRLEPALRAFAPQDLRDWAAGLGEETFVGSSGRVFPRSFKASPLLRAWLRRLAGLGVELRTRCDFRGFAADGALRIVSPAGHIEIVAGATVLALGGASWPRLGADGGWVEALVGQGVAVAPLRPANCGFRADWSAHFAERFAGQPLKPAVFAFAGRSLRGETMITTRGLEGGAIYALARDLRDAIERDGSALLRIDLRPDVEAPALTAKLAPRGGKSLATRLRQAGLSPQAAGLLREAGAALPGEPAALAALIKSAPVRLVATAGLARAISTAGGVELSEVNDNFMLMRRPGVFLAGEMLDWEAPTGGYLLQACFATGAAAARGALHWLASGS